MTDQELEVAIIAVIKSMREATRQRRIELIPDLQNKLLQAVTEYMTK